jgi:hypothetical protein
MSLIDCLGWSATLIFVASYFFKGAEAIRRVQMAGAILWMAYGAVMHAPPVIVANLLVLVAAAWTARRSRLPPVHESSIDR